MHPHDMPMDALPSDDSIRHLRIPPHSNESESAVLGGLLLSPVAWEHCADLLTADDFYRAEHRAVFEAISSLVAHAKPVDVVTVFTQLQADGKAADAGGLTTLNALAQYVPSAANIRRYAEVIRERAILRRMVTVGDELAASAFDPAGSDAGALLDGAMGKLQALQLRGVRSKPVPVQSMVVGFIDRIQALADGDVQPGLPTRIPGLDRMLGGGLKPGKQVILAARPSVGKSSFAQQLCLNLARDGHACAILSQEMGNDELMDRAVANLGRVSLENLQTGRLADGEDARMAEALDGMRDIPLLLDDQSGLALADISAKARLLKRQHGVKVIVLDYLQLCTSAKAKDSRHHQIEELSRGIKHLAKQLEVTFISLSQLNRDVEKRTDGRAKLSDLKESGAIEEDADVVILLSRHGDNKEGPRQIVCDVPKNRQGRVGELGLIFEGEFQRWSESAEPFRQQPAGRARASRSYAEDF